MAASTVPIDELGAINTMLVMIGESPISTLEVSGLADVAVAQKIFGDTLREVQEIGWNFNTEEAYQLVPDSEGFINLPTNTLRVDCDYVDAYRNVTQRGSRLYDRENHTYVFSTGVYVNLVQAFPFTTLPQAARWYVTVKATRRFVAGRSQSDLLYQFSERDELEALGRLQQADCQTADPNMIWDSTLPRSIADRRI